MNPDLYTDEFRNFKYLKSTPATVNFYKEYRAGLNKIQPWATVNDPSFRWPYLIEFFEQIIDLTDETIYMVVPGNLNHGDSGYGYEDATLYTLSKPLLYHGSIFNPNGGRPVDLDDIFWLEDMETDDCYFLCSEEFRKNKVLGNIFPARLLPIVNRGYTTHEAMFYDKDTAFNYKESLTAFLRKNSDIISAINRLI